MGCIVYGLSGPDGVIRYIGQTRTSVKYRLGNHWRDAKRKPHSRLYQWMRETKKITATILHDNCVWDETEIAVIAIYRKQYPGVLFNISPGGSPKGKPSRAKKKRGSKRVKPFWSY